MKNRCILNGRVFEMSKDAHFSYSSLCAPTGGWGNTMSVIRKQIGGTNLAVDNSPRASCTLRKPFWISWASSTLRVGEGYIVGTGSFLSYTDTSPTPVNRFMISTGVGSSGQWQLGESFKYLDWPGVGSVSPNLNSVHTATETS